MGTGSTTATPYHPLIHRTTPLIDFIHSLTQNAPSSGTTLIICTTQSSFLQHLHKSIITNYQTALPHEGNDDDDPPHPASTNLPDHPLFARTLRLLAITRQIKLLFCPSLPAFHALLATLSFKLPPAARDEDQPPPMLAILNMVQLQRPTASYSAQGLGKAFAAAVEAAWAVRRRLVFFEYVEAVDTLATALQADRSDPVGDSEASDVDDVGEEGGGEAGRRQEVAGVDDPWMEEVQIPNATTKTFGYVGSRGWMGRTVRVVDVAWRWCEVVTLPGTEPRSG